MTSWYGPWRTSALLALALALVAGGGEATSEVDRVLDGVQTRYDAVRGLTGRFVQVAFVASLGREERSRGRVAVKRPGRMRWEYEAPDARVIAVDGDDVRIYSPDDRQLQIAALDAGAFSPTALDFLLGSGDLREVFDAELAEAEADGDGDGDRDGGGVVVLHLTPRSPARFERLELWLAPGTHELRGSVVVDVFGNRTEVRFEDLVETDDIPEATFRIDVPEGTDVIDLRPK